MISIKNSNAGFYIGIQYNLSRCMNYKYTIRKTNSIVWNLMGIIYENYF